MHTQAYAFGHGHRNAHSHTGTSQGACSTGMACTQVRKHACSHRCLYTHMSTHSYRTWGSQACTQLSPHMYNPYTHRNAHACAVIMHTHTDIQMLARTYMPNVHTRRPPHAHTHMHTPHECLQSTPSAHSCTCMQTAHTHTGTAHTGTHKTLPGTSEEEEEEKGRHIILFPPVQMTCLLGTNFCFDIFCYFIRSRRHGTRTKPRGFTDG